jgi:hypothetical protein
MRQLTFIKKGRVEWQEGPEPRLTGPLQAIVRPFAAACCDGDCVPLFRTLPRFMNAGICGIQRYHDELGLTLKTSPAGMRGNVDTVDR